MYSKAFSTKKIIEIGSGFSSSLILDVNELYFNNKMSCTFIEPYTDRLLSLLKDNEQINIIEKNLQDVELSVFSELSAGDMLFVDSTHVSKTGSDVNYIFFDIMPILKKGVIIHFHDILFPFEYDKEWIYEGRAWNEAYMLRTFLQFNQSFKMNFWNSYFTTIQKDILYEKMPLCLKNDGGSIWIQKIK